MMDVESIDLADETPEVDAAKQRLAVAVEDESGLGNDDFDAAETRCGICACTKRRRKPDLG